MTEQKTIPVPSAEEQKAPGFRAADWALRNGTCPYHGGAHDLVASSVYSEELYCRLCRERETDLIAKSQGGIYVIAED